MFFARRDKKSGIFALRRIFFRTGMIENNIDKTIVALSTSTGGALCVVRLSGADSQEIVAKHFAKELKPRVATFGAFRDSEGRVVDEVVVTYFAAPRSYTGEDSVEISCHGSAWIASEIVAQCIASGAVAASEGEFSKRAFMSGKMDLSQVEAVADLIASDSAASARLALQQMRGGYSEEFRVLRDELLSVLALLELELDFGDEDVEFADRGQLVGIIDKIQGRVRELSSSFRLGNVLKNGIPVAIVGAPNVGKSTLLNKLVGESRAIVSDVAGTTRDFIEAEMTIEGVVFRFIDTAGLRESDCEIERQGIERSREQLSKATVIIHLQEAGQPSEAIEVLDGQRLIKVLNKVDDDNNIECDDKFLPMSAKYGHGIAELKELLVSDYRSESTTTDTVVSNMRHYEALLLSDASFTRARTTLIDSLPAELTSAELRDALSHLQLITGQITTTDLLTTIFSNFCIGK